LSSDIDSLAAFETAGALTLSKNAPTRYAVRQVLDQELQRTIAQRENAARQARLRMGGDIDPAFVFDNKENPSRKHGAVKNRPEKMSSTNTAIGDVKRDFFGRVLVDKPSRPGPLGEADGNAAGARKRNAAGDAPGARRVWVTYH
jgi:chromosome transmission fidelity protein 18